MGCGAVKPPSGRRRVAVGGEHAAGRGGLSPHRGSSPARAAHVLEAAPRQLCKRRAAPTTELRRPPLRRAEKGFVFNWGGGREAASGGRQGGQHLRRGRNGALSADLRRAPGKRDRPAGMDWLSAALSGGGPGAYGCSPPGPDSQHPLPKPESPLQAAPREELPAPTAARDEPPQPPAPAPSGQGKRSLSKGHAHKSEHCGCLMAF